MKNKVRARSNAATKAASLQTKTARRTPVELSSVPSNQSPENAEKVIPSQIADECKNALSLLKDVGSAAGALVMLNADAINENVKSDSDWRAMESPRFAEGSQELARMMVGEFHSVYNELSGYLSGLIQSIENCNEPIKSVSRVRYCGLLQRDRSRAGHEIENTVRSFQHCLKIQGSALGRRKNIGAWDIGRLMQDRLDEAFDIVWAAKGKLEGAYLAATVHYNPASVERMVAA